MRVVWRLGMWLVVLVMIGSAMSNISSREADGPPSLLFDANVPDELRDLTEEVWTEFLVAIPGRQDCIGELEVIGVPGLDNLGTYYPGINTIALRIPGTRSGLSSTLAHEFAHHLDSNCATVGMRNDFLRAQGFSSGTNWWEAPTWESTPSEHFAEAIVIVVLGVRPNHSEPVIKPASVDVLRSWVAG